MTHKANQLRVSVSVLAVVFSFNGFAATGPSWVQDQTYSQASPTDSRGSGESGRRSTYRGNRGGRDVAPFTPGSHNIAVDMGQIFLMGDLNAKYQDNLGWRLHYTYGVSDIFGFDASVGYSEHSNSKFGLAVGNLGVRTNLTWFDKVIPYMVFGLGFYRAAYDTAATGPNGQGIQSVAPFLFGIHVGPGVTLQLSKLFFIGMSVNFHNMFGTQRGTTDTGPANVGGAFTSFFLNAGFTL